MLWPHDRSQNDLGTYLGLSIAVFEQVPEILSSRFVSSRAFHEMEENIPDLDYTPQLVTQWSFRALHALRSSSGHLALESSLWGRHPGAINLQTGWGALLGKPKT